MWQALAHKVTGSGGRRFETSVTVHLKIHLSSASRTRIAPIDDRLFIRGSVLGPPFRVPKLRTFPYCPGYVQPRIFLFTSMRDRS